MRCRCIVSPVDRRRTVRTSERHRASRARQRAIPNRPPAGRPHPMKKGAGAGGAYEEGRGRDARHRRAVSRGDQVRPGRMGGYALDWAAMPAPHKNYASPIATVALPAPLTGQAANVWEVFGRRRSTRDFSPAQSLPLGPALVHLGHDRQRRRVVFQGRPLGRGALPHRDLHPRKGRRGARSRDIPLQAPRIRSGVYQGRQLCDRAGRSRPRTGDDPGGAGDVHMDGHRGEERVEVPAKGLPVHLYGCRPHRAEPVSRGDGGRPRGLGRGRLLR